MTPQTTTASIASVPDQAEALRTEHDGLAQKLATRLSIDHLRRAAYAGFATFIAGGLTIKFAWDRWGPHHKALRGRPLFFLLALAVSLLLLGFTLVSAWRARQLMRTEDCAFARFREIRAKLGLDP